ncbi:Intradiol ring-cleavage dioxygenase, core [Beauveria brongniartii RCEF 3172]|uniref:Intradiol ring-cleavage dioxygenase, core n=1 Tax=Beauveria brongniartii RCEF 3172 TaxID=1081107 RepID=A0A167BUI7_9HYPO|nr:Intradiol ring-cleavage dioxygenase, core [Beauveria brongniartii RCEF 3172]
MYTNIISLGLGLISIPLVASHPGQDHDKAAMKRREFLKNNVASLDHCGSKLDALGVTERSIQRRQSMIHGIREKRGLVARDQGQDHEARNYNAEVGESSIFRSNASCVLAPEEDLGPYYVAGESIRSNIIENQTGVPIYLDIQFINVDTCQPVVGSYVDVWQANATGVYGGVVQQGSENRNDTWEETWGLTWLRGIQQTNKDGAVHFETIFPGHYEDRTTHIHVLTHPHATLLPNKTIIDDHASHVGQMYFDQDLIDRVEELAPYNTNNQPKLSNAEDKELKGDLEAGGYPYLHYQLVGDELADGLLAWLSFGILATEDKVVDPMTTYHPKPTKPANACA